MRLGVGRRAFRFCFFVPAAAARATLILTPATAFTRGARIYPIATMSKANMIMPEWRWGLSFY